MKEVNYNYPKKKLAKSSVDKKICGVCGGIAEYTGIDSSIIRIITLLLIFSGVGFFSYFIIALILPSDYEVYNEYQNRSKAFTSNENIEDNINDNSSNNDDWID